MSTPRRSSGSTSSSMSGAESVVMLTLAFVGSRSNRGEGYFSSSGGFPPSPGANVLKSPCCPASRSPEASGRSPSPLSWLRWVGSVSSNIWGILPVWGRPILARLSNRPRRPLPRVQPKHCETCPGWPAIAVPTATPTLEHQFPWRLLAVGGPRRLPISGTHIPENTRYFYKFLYQNLILLDTKSVPRCNI